MSAFDLRRVILKLFDGAGIAAIDLDRSQFQSGCPG